MTPPALYTKRLVLRPFQEQDRPDIAAALGDYEVSKWLATVPHPFTQDDVRITEAEGATLWPELAGIALDGRLIGAITVRESLGYWIARPHWGQGYMSEAAEAMLGAYFDRGHKAICTCVFDGNPGSARVLTRLGFVETGRGTHHCAARNADLPETEYTLTRAAWEARV